MKVAVITNSEERCGNAEYGRVLCSELSKYFEIESMPKFPTSGYDAVLLNWHPPVVKFSLEDIRNARSNGMKTVLLIQESFPSLHMVGSDDTLCLVDAVVAHEQMDIRTSGKVKFKMIPHGIVEVEDLPPVLDGEPRVGTAGFCFGGKQMEVTISAAYSVSGKAVMIAPEHPWSDARPLWDKFQRMYGEKLELVTQFLPVKDVVKKLATCHINVYAAQENAPGQSGSARMIIAARRPTIIIRDRKTCQLFPYEDELYFVDSVDEMPALTKSIWDAIQHGGSVKLPKQVIKDCGWTHTGQMFRDLLLEATCV